MNVSKEDVLGALAKIEDPERHRNIVELGLVKHIAVCDGKVKATIELNQPACSSADDMSALARQAILELPGVTDAAVELAASRPQQNAPQPQVSQMSVPKDDRFPNIRSVIAVSSGKGGVGKSTTSVNLAIALASSGARVGLLDADVYGPDVPMMLGISGEPRFTEERKVLPHERFGVKVLSIGFFLPEDDAPVIWRGPMIHKFLEQMFTDADWGEIDYLIVDMPPGTGDVQLSITDILPLTGAVVVTTPQNVATLDVSKAIAMFQKVEVEVLGIVENMAYFLCPDNGKRYEIFGKGGGRKLAARYGLDLLGQVPINPQIGAGGDRGEPIVVSDPECEEARVVAEIASQVAAKTAALKRKAASHKELPVL